MKYAVVQLFENGIRRPRDEATVAAPEVGELTVTDYEHYSTNNPDLVTRQRVAHLTAMYNRTVRRDLFHPLFDPVLVKMTRGGFVLRGMQIDARDGTVREVVQEWWVRPIEAVVRVSTPPVAFTKASHHS